MGHTVHYYYRRFRLDGAWIKSHDSIRGKGRKKAGRKVAPSAAIMDSQSVKTTKKGGPNAAMTLASTSRDASVTSWWDTTGLLLMVVVHAANVSAQAGAPAKQGASRRDQARRARRSSRDCGYSGWTQAARPAGIFVRG